MYMFLAFMYILTVYCQSQTQFVMGQLCCHQVQSNYNYLKFLVKLTDSYAAQLRDFNR